MCVFTNLSLDLKQGLLITKMGIAGPNELEYSAV